MIEHALAKAYGDPAAQPETSRLRAVLPDLTLFGLSVALTFILMPPIYLYAVYAARGPDIMKSLDDGLGLHIAMNCAANLVVLVGSMRLSGRFDRKLAGVFSRMLMVHGFLAFAILTTRQFHSNQVMLMAAGASVILGLLIMYLKHRATRLQIALIGPWDAAANQVRPACDWIEAPDADLSKYDVLLTGSVTELSPEWTTTLSRAMLVGKPVRHLAEFVEEDQGLVMIEHFDLDHITPLGLTSYRLRKRVMDIGIALAALPVALPILAIAAVALLVTAGQPILFKQSRIGLGGRPFQMYKLRTMRTPEPADAARATTSRADARITPLGRHLRRFRIDELPQLWNVLRGEMSIVGPRPEWSLLSDDYTRALPAYAYRHLVRPGITGWAQVRGGYASDLAQTRTKLGYDLFYIKNLSFALDVQILIRTCWTLLTGSGAR